MTCGVFMSDSDMIDELVMSRLRKRADSLTQREVAQSATELRSHAFSILAGLQPIFKIQNRQSSSWPPAGCSQHSCRIAANFQNPNRQSSSWPPDRRPVQRPGRRPENPETENFRIN